MTNQEIQSYEQMGIPVGKKRKKGQELGFYELLEYGLLFLLSKIYLFGAVSPLGIAYFAAVFPRHKRIFCLVAGCLGIVAAGMELVAMKYMGAMVIVCVFSVLMDRELSDHNWLYAVVAGGSLLVTGMVFVIFDGFLLYDCLLLLLEVILTVLSFFALTKASEVIRSMHTRTVFEPVESLSLVLLCAGVVMSLEMVPYFRGLGHIISLVIIFIAAMTGGFPLSCAAGITLGVVNSIGDVLPAQIVAVYSLCGLCSGLLQHRGRWGVLLGFLLTNSIAALYFSGSANRVIAFYYILAAGAVLFLLPDRFLSLFGEVMKSPAYQEDSVLRIREMMEDKLSAVSASFEELSKVFHDAVSNHSPESLCDSGYLFDKTADQICRGCTLMNYCWHKEYNETKAALLLLYRKMEMRGQAVAEDVPAGFKNECIRLEAFLEILNKNYDVQKVNMLWAGRVSESRSLVAEQFNNVSSVLKHLKKELTFDPTNGMRMERKIAAALDRRGIEASHIRVSGAEALEVTLTLNSCGGERVCSKNVAAIIGHAVGVPMLRLPSVCSEDVCRLRFLEQPRYTMESGFARVAGGNNLQSGDHHMMSVSADGKYILALSDGMGHGSRAEAQSGLTIHLIRQLLSAGFDKETALRLINSMLMVTAEQESFATADLCLVNLYSGAFEFIKIGAASSYVKRQNEVEKIGCTSLPAGILCDVEADCDLKFAQEGDYVVMVTDGITDVLEQGDGNCLLKLIENFGGASAQQLADEILYAAAEASGGAPKDDMTVLAARLIQA